METAYEFDVDLQLPLSPESTSRPCLELYSESIFRFSATEIQRSSLIYGHGQTNGMINGI